MLHRVLLFVVVLLVIAPATAVAAEGGDPARLDDLADDVGQATPGTVDGQLALEDRLARLEARVTALDARLFAARFEAKRALGSIMTGPAVERLDSAGRWAPSVQVAGVALNLTDSSDVAALEAMLGDWSRLVDALDELEEVRDSLGAAGEIESLRTCPVAGPHTFGDTWGEWRPGGRPHKGTDMVAAHGTPLVAAEDGSLTQVGRHWAGGVGLYLVGDATGDVYYYAHLADVAPGIETGAVVRRGELLGWVGQTGNADVPHLHLGWMPGAGALDLAALENPYSMLSGLCR
jgi:murein DD-endopeptidase MepM/ murein hydrolase activator NlpD